MGRKTKAKRPVPANDIAMPPLEQIGAFMVEPVHDRTPNGGLNLKGMAYRRRPMIDVLAAAGMFSDAEHKALRHYRHHADIADRSLVRDSLCFQRGGNGAGMTIATLNAVRLVADCERAAGTLRDILRAVVVDDVSLSQWAIARHGGLDKIRTRKGRVERAVEPTERHLKFARQDIKVAAERVEAELAA